MKASVQLFSDITASLNKGITNGGYQLTLPPHSGPWTSQSQHLGHTQSLHRTAIMHVTTLLQFGRQQDDPMGHLLWANMEAFHLEAGLSGQLFGMPLTILPCMTTMLWFTQMWQYCKTLDINIITDIIDFELTGYQDKEIMRIFLQFRATGQDLASLNRCQMYVHAIYLSDICNSSGTTINNN